MALESGLWIVLKIVELSRGEMEIKKYLTEIKYEQEFGPISPWPCLSSY